MESILPQVRSTSERAPGHEGSATPFAQQTVVLTKQASLQRTWEAHAWRRQHARLGEREAALQAEVETLRATIRDLTQRLYGAKSEQASGCDAARQCQPASPRNRGQPPGSKGHGRSDRAALPVMTAVHTVSETAKQCPACGAACAPFPGSEESHLIAVQVQAPLRRIQRQRDHKTCQCPHVPGMVTAPPAPRLIPPRPLGVAGWTMVLLDKDLYGRPTSRLCEQRTHHG
jgi:transposase